MRFPCSPASPSPIAHPRQVVDRPADHVRLQFAAARSGLGGLTPTASLLCVKPGSVGYRYRELHRIAAPWRRRRDPIRRC